jgi:thiamine biosynthesis lipoprotein
VVKIRKLLDSTGWQKLEVDESVPSLRKDDPSVQIDLGSLLQGYAVDRAYELLAKHGLKEFLVEVGGELRAAGAWDVALDPAAGAWTTPTVRLHDQALSTSGVYRRGPQGEEKHVISPRTGRPAATAWRAVAVMAPTCREADGWDTALLVAGDGRTLAEERGLNVQMLPAGEGAGVQVGEWSAK